MRQYSGVQVLAFALLVLGTGAAVVSIVTNYWSYYSYDFDTVSSAVVAAAYSSGRRGLWEQCNTKRLGGNEECSSRFEALRDQIQEGDFSDITTSYDMWEVACLALMCASGIFGVLAMIFAPCLCARCGCCLSIFVFLAGISAATGAGCYAYFHWSGKVGSRIGLENLADKVKPEQFGYSFWCAVAASILQVISSLLFAGGGRYHTYSQTI